MAGPEKKEKCPEGLPDWLMTFGDLNSLLLTFFVLLVSMMVIDPLETQLILSAFQGSFGVLEGGQTLNPGMLAQMGSSFETLPSEDKGRGMAKAIREAKSVFEPEVKTRKVRVTYNERGIVISLSADAYFKPASAELDIESARTVLEKLSVLLSRSYLANRQVQIEGHTDNTATDPEGPWPTNWELGSGRAMTVLNYLVDFGAKPDNLSAITYGEYKPVFPNVEEEHRAKNRRVDVVIMRKNE